MSQNCLSLLSILWTTTNWAQKALEPFLQYHTVSGGHWLPLRLATHWYQSGRLENPHVQVTPQDNSAKSPGLRHSISVIVRHLQHLQGWELLQGRRGFVGFFGLKQNGNFCTRLQYVRGYRSISFFDLESFPLNSLKQCIVKDPLGVRTAIIYLLCYLIWIKLFNLVKLSGFWFPSKVYDITIPIWWNTLKNKISI